MGVTSVIPEINFSRPAHVDPSRVVQAIRDWHVTQAFASPSLWNRVGRYCMEQGIQLGSLRRVLSAGAPVPVEVLERMKSCLPPECEMHTPYGATEALPVASISATEVLQDTGARTAQGAGVCVGRRFAETSWKVIRATHEPIASLDDAVELGMGEIGELVVCGSQVTKQYVTAPQSNVGAKISSAQGQWHRMGDVGYLDAQDRFWYCGRANQRVQTAAGPMETICCEAIFNQHGEIERTALVGVGPPRAQHPVLVAQPLPGRMPRSPAHRARLLAELQALGAANPMTQNIDRFLLCRSLPVDVRHNAKISREALAIWAAKRLRRSSA
jgi:acyl-CoA synthetase (AMP-forming)/AMP-acid ligase II